jgi:hypothetical protein
VENPTRHLVDPGDPEPYFGDGYADPFDIFGMISPTHWINEFLKELAGWDVIGWISENFTGEWSAYAKCGMAFENLGRSLQDLGVNIQQGAIDVDKYWDGNAADAAYKYFSDVAAATSGTQVALYKASEEYARAAKGIWLFANQISGIVEAIIDAAVIAGITAAAGTALIETGVGAVVGYGLSALEAARIIELIGKAGTVIQTAGTVIMGIGGAIVGLAHQGGDLKALALPDRPYDHPAVVT